MKSAKVQLPNGMQIVASRKEEALLVYDEVGDYVKNGLTLKPGDLVFDVGANIGLFSLWAYEQCQGDISIFAFEPLPPVFAHLKANLQQLDSEHVRALNCGLSSENRSAEFAYYPHATIASTAYPDTKASELQLTSTLLGRHLHHLPRPLQVIKYLPGSVQRKVLNLAARYVNQRKFVSCELCTLSSVVEKYGLDRIDLLKIDAEKSEWDVLAGIKEAHWPLVKQLFVEVHDHEGRLTQIEACLRQHGFEHIVTEQDPLFAGTEIYAVYAAR